MPGGEGETNVERRVDETEFRRSVCGRLDSLEQGHVELRDGLAANTVLTQQIVANTQALIDIWEGTRALWEAATKVACFVSKWVPRIAKVVTVLALMGTALYSFYDQVAKH